MSKIVVSGGMGYIGRVLVPYLVQAGHSVTVIDNFRFRQVDDIKDCEVINADVRKIRIPPCDFYIPLAGIVGAPLCNQYLEEAAQVNVEHIEHFLTYRDNTRIIYPTTNSGYGSGICDETSPLLPCSYYGKQKVFAESLILKSGNAVTLRLATVFGVSPCHRSDLLVNWLVLQAVLGREVSLYESHFTRNYVHIRDVARCFLYCVANFDQMRDNAYNFGLSDANLSKRELCLEIQKVVPSFRFKEVQGVKDPDQRNYIVSNAKIEAKGVRAIIPLGEGIEELVEFYKNRMGV